MKNWKYLLEQVRERSAFLRIIISTNFYFLRHFFRHHRHILRRRNILRYVFRRLSFQLLWLRCTRSHFRENNQNPRNPFFFFYFPLMSFFDLREKEKRDFIVAGRFYSLFQTIFFLKPREILVGLHLLFFPFKIIFPYFSLNLFATYCVLREK